MGKILARSARENLLSIMCCAGFCVSPFPKTVHQLGNPMMDRCGHMFESDDHKGTIDR
jgi:hypothetical protein